jgi:PBP1b-binding outer membrane lipoprotein LpoB
MKQLMIILYAAALTLLLAGCLSTEEQENQTNQRRYDSIIKKNQEMIDRNQKQMPDQNQ